MKDALVMPATKLALLVGKPPYGCECHHWPEPQLMMPVGYSPLSG